ncbi:hypothetical protein CCACVL1_12471 [Corchorus capsularis]|uniref:Receptor-like protein 12 n=1 Tax=Corchorus capsularis TaxID=210143 RepID=A0A1R3IFH7_COCAP|nr:hypothetical protein CCACVL1_12471 [Corchorus capsularis]
MSWLGTQTKLDYLSVEGTNSYGHIPASLKNLTQITVLRFGENHFSGRIPSWIGNLTQLVQLSLIENELQGPIPQSLLSLVNLVDLNLALNYLSGTINLEQLLHLKNLERLQLSENDFSPSSQAFLLTAHQDELGLLSLADNKIVGRIPEWLPWGLSAKSLVVLDLHQNFLTGFDQPNVVPQWTTLKNLDLRFNKLQGSLPIPPLSVYHYLTSNNFLTGEISPVICTLTSLTVLNFSGMLPPCLSNLSTSLSILNLKNNSFVGPIPQTCKEGSKLRMIDFSQNQFQGQIPESMVHCSMLESLNLGNNRMKDTFPSQLGKLAELKILILRHNEFHGAILGNPGTDDGVFPKLRILDLSFNKFACPLPSQHFQRWEAMKVVDSSKLTYLESAESFDAPGGETWAFYVSYLMTMTKKGVETKYDKIQEFLVAIDLSSNQFEGSIPQDIQILKAVQLLNLSNNFLSGAIPPSLGELTNLESLDLSQNKLSGGIPQELAQLTFLGLFNVSHNQLTGPIPQGKQFPTFDNSSFEGNSGLYLCGNPLSKKCHNSEASPPPWSTPNKDGGDILFEFGWKIVVLGYGSGLVVGLILGYTFNPWKHKWFLKYFGGNKQQTRKPRN